MPKQRNITNNPKRSTSSKSAGRRLKAKSSPAKNAKTRVAGPKARKRPIEQYDHKDKTRVNNPPVGLVTSETDKETGKKTYQFDPHIDPALQFDSQKSQIENIIDEGLGAESIDDVKAALKELKKRQEPYLNWAGKAEHTSFEVPTVSLHVHERIDPRTIIEAVKKRNGSDQQTSFFEQLDKEMPLRHAVEFYKHPHNWSNRLIAGDSLVVMNSLLEKEGLAGQVQMIYIDPPYGIKYGSNFQPFINNRSIRDGKDEDLSQEPEMIRAFRDTWELGIHSYLTYLRDRLKLAKALLKDSGSVFLQINDENLHLARGLLDEIFGRENFVSVITFTKTTSATSIRLAGICDFLLFYAKNIEQLKYRQLFKDKELFSEGGLAYSHLELPNGTRRSISKEERENPLLIPKGSNPYTLGDLTSQRPPGSFPVEFNGKTFHPKSNFWKTGKEGFSRLIKANRIEEVGTVLRYIRYFNDFPVFAINNVWTEFGGAPNKDYVVETNDKILQRCLLMATDTGDLVLDPTCGSGTTAYVAEQWGRRWITCDTSRVAITLAKRRLMTSIYDYYKLAYPDQGVGSGFEFRVVPHITLKSIANDEPPGEETIYDQPLVDGSKARVSGPFTVEAVPAPMVKPVAEITGEIGDDQPADISVGRKGETLRHSEWKDELFKTGIRGKGGQKIEFTRVETLPGTRYLHAEAETKDKEPQRVVVSFGPEHVPLEQRQVEMAIEEAQKLVPKPKIIVFASFQFDPEAAKDIDETDWPGVTLLKVQMNTDLLTEDLKKKRSSNESFWLIGQPDVLIHTIKERGKLDKYRVDLMGFDYYNTKTGQVESGGTEKIAMWMLDTDYDGRSLYPRQVFFPMAGPNESWARLAKNLKAEIDEDLIEMYRGVTSLDFEAGEHRRIAVKIIDDRGIESMVVKGLDI